MPIVQKSCILHYCFSCRQWHRQSDFLIVEFWHWTRFSASILFYCIISLFLYLTLKINLRLFLVNSKMKMQFKLNSQRYQCDFIFARSSSSVRPFDLYSSLFFTLIWLTHRSFHEHLRWHLENKRASERESKCITV